jgi:hypothetical protein|tara:strand:- start:13 stop:660 length:648 start_codon:yes stop_codon:yes gene_type:complete
MRLKRIILTLFIISLVSCDNNYEKEEFKAIEDITNNYLLKNHLNKMMEKPQIPSENEIEEVYERPFNVDTLDLKVYLSDALLPISQIKEDNEWMFDDNYFGTKDSTIFHSIVNSREFKNLKYREFDKNKIQFIKPYRQFEKSNEKLKENEEYSLLSFSRVCFDEKKENGIVVIEYRQGSKGWTSYGNHMAFLIKKTNEKWEYIPRNRNIQRIEIN